MKSKERCISRGERCFAPALTILLVILLSFSVLSQKDQPFEGIWKSEAYGRVIKIKKNRVTTYELTGVSCTPYKEVGSMKYYKRFYRPVFQGPDTMVLNFGRSKYKYFRIKGLPQKCNGEPYNMSPILNFDSFISSFKTYYSFTKERDINWDELEIKYRPRINKETTDLELLEVFESIIKEIDDKHTKMVWVPKKARNEYNTLHKREQFNYDSIWVEAQNSAARRYLKKVNNFNYNTAIWGITNDNLGYLQINDMVCFNRFNVSQTLTDSNNWKQFEKKWNHSSDYENDNVKVVRKLMNIILKEFENTDGLILDFRFNEGGYAFNAVGLLSFFNDSVKNIFTEKAKTEVGYTEPYSIKLQSQPNSYTKKTVLLTSRGTLSGGEIFTLGSLSLPQITRIGNNTSGHFSSFCGKAIPNGWTYYMSMEVCKDMNGNNYEEIGITPHIKTNSITSAIPFYKDLIKKEKDVTMEKAIEFLKQ